MKKKQAITVSSHPAKCPQCGGKVVEIAYGFPSNELFEEFEKGNVILGGCDIVLDKAMPDWECTSCHQQFIKSAESVC